MDLRPHDLLRIVPDASGIPDDAPAWAARELAREEPWVVVRRAFAQQPGMAAVGVRGSARHERWAFSVSRSRVRGRTTPEALAGRWSWRTVRASRRGLPAFAVLDPVSELLAGRGLAWGPGGSVGYELASGLPAVTEESDLDLILRCPEPLPGAIALEILENLASLPVRADAQIDTGTGSLALAEWAAGGEVLLRRAEGPILTDDPWCEPARTLTLDGIVPERDRR